MKRHLTVLVIAASVAGLAVSANAFGASAHLERAACATPKVLNSPLVQLVGAGETVTFHASGFLQGGPAPAVEWQVSTDGKTWKTAGRPGYAITEHGTAGTTDTTLAFSGQQFQNGYRFRAIFGGPGCQATTKVADATIGKVGAKLVVTSCKPGYADVDKVAANGCEVNLMTDANNCGAAGNVIHLANAVAGCKGGVGVIASCNEGFANADGVNANGCESKSSTNTAPGTSSGGASIVEGPSSPPKANLYIKVPSGTTSWRIDFGDGQSTTGKGKTPPIVSHVYAKAGTYTATITAKIGSKEATATGPVAI